MATVEGLFNFDEKLLARDVAGQRQDYMFGNNMPKGYGAVGMGWNKMLRGLFNNDDPILKEKALAEEALQLTQQQLGGDMSDPSKMYGVLIQNLNKLGASPQSVSQVADKKAIIDTTATQTSIDNSLKLMAIDDKRKAGDQEDREKLRTQIERTVGQISKEISGDSLTQIKSAVLEAANPAPPMVAKYPPHAANPVPMRIFLGFVFIFPQTAPIPRLIYFFFSFFSFSGFSFFSFSFFSFFSFSGF